MFLHLDAKLNWHRAFEALIEGFDSEGLARRQREILRRSGVLEAARGRLTNPVEINVHNKTVTKCHTGLGKPHMARYSVRRFTSGFRSTSGI